MLHHERINVVDIYELIDAHVHDIFFLFLVPLIDEGDKGLVLLADILFRVDVLFNGDVPPPPQSILFFYMEARDFPCLFFLSSIHKLIT